MAKQTYSSLDGMFVFTTATIDTVLKVTRARLVVGFHPEDRIQNQHIIQNGLLLSMGSDFHWDFDPTGDYLPVVVFESGKEPPVEGLILIADINPIGGRL